MAIAGRCDEERGKDQERGGDVGLHHAPSDQPRSIGVPHACEQRAGPRWLAELLVATSFGVWVVRSAHVVVRAGEAVGRLTGGNCAAICRRNVARDDAHHRSGIGVISEQLDRPC